MFAKKIFLLITITSLSSLFPRHAMDDQDPWESDFYVEKTLPALQVKNSTKNVKKQECTNVADSSDGEYLQSEEELRDFVQECFSEFEQRFGTKRPFVGWNNSELIVDSWLPFSKKTIIGKQAYKLFTKNEIRALLASSWFKFGFLSQFFTISSFARGFLDDGAAVLLSYCHKSFSGAYLFSRSGFCFMKAILAADKLCLQVGLVEKKDLMSALEKTSAKKVFQNRYFLFNFAIGSALITLTGSLALGLVIKNSKNIDLALSGRGAVKNFIDEYLPKIKSDFLKDATIAAIFNLLIIEAGKRNHLPANFNPCNFTQARINALRTSNG